MHIPSQSSAHKKFDCLVNRQDKNLGLGLGKKILTIFPELGQLFHHFTWSLFSGPIGKAYFSFNKTEQDVSETTFRVLYSFLIVTVILTLPINIHVSNLTFNSASNSHIIHGFAGIRWRFVQERHRKTDFSFNKTVQNVSETTFRDLVFFLDCHRNPHSTYQYTCF